MVAPRRARRVFNWDCARSAGIARATAVYRSPSSENASAVQVNGPAASQAAGPKESCTFVFPGACVLA